MAVNAGSSSVKIGAYLLDGVARPRRLQEALTMVATQRPTELRLVAQHAGRTVCDVNLPFTSHLTDLVESALGAIAGLIEAHMPWAEVVGIGHRIVHGGDRYRMPTPLTQTVMDALATLVPLAPLHLPANLHAVTMLQRQRVRAPQFACFDTGFHADLMQAETWCAVPRAWRAQGVRRYGFHGLAFESVMAQLPPEARQERVLLAHLGSGASLCAVLRGRSVATTMGFSALEGLVMGTRCGSLDAGVVLHMLRQPDLGLADVERILFERSGLLGVSGLSPDMRDLLAAEADRPDVAEAIELFCHRVVREAGGLIALMGGVDRLVFSGGIGEHAASLRQRIVDRLDWLGVRLDPDANARHARNISPDEAMVAVHVVPADEQRVIAAHVARLIGAWP